MNKEKFVPQTKPNKMGRALLSRNFPILHHICTETILKHTFVFKKQYYTEMDKTRCYHLRSLPGFGLFNEQVQHW